MNNTPRCEKGDIIINFRDMLMHILHRWPSILVGILLVALLASGYQYVTDKQGYDSALAAEKDKTATVQLEGLSLANANQVLQYQKIYKMQAEYNRSAPLMQIDPSAVDSEMLSYLVTGQRAYVTASLYQTHLSSVSLYEKLATEITPTYDPAQLMELVTVKLQYDPNTENTTRDVIFSIKVIAPTKDMCTVVSSAIKAGMNSLRRTVTDAVGAHTLSLVANTAQVNTDMGLRSTQQNNLNNCNTLRTALKTARDALSADELAYVEQMAVLEENPDDTTPPAPPSLSKKMLLIGAVAGFALLVCIHAAVYLFSRKLKSREDLTQRYGIMVFGALADTAKKRGFTDRILRRLFFKKESALTAEEHNALTGQQFVLAVKTALADKTTTNLLVIGGEKSDALLAPLTDLLSKEDITLTTVSNPVYNAVALEQLTAADAVVLAETVGVSVYGDIYRTLDLCAQLDRPVIGALVIE